jgi:DNA-binding beta-propeller fold protein YncE
MAVALLLLLARHTLAAGVSPLAISIIRKIPAHGLSSLAVNPATNRLYVLSWWGPDGPPSVFASASVSALDGSSHAVIGFMTGLGPRAFDLAVDPVRDSAYMTIATIDSPAEKIDAKTNKWLGRVSLPNPMQLATSIAVNPKTGFAYVAEWKSSIGAIDPGSLKVTRQFRTGDLPIGLTVSPVTNSLYLVTNGDIRMIDLSSNEVLPMLGRTFAPLPWTKLMAECTSGAGAAKFLESM